MPQQKNSAAPARRPDRLPPVTMRGMRLVYRNFAGRETQYNAEGDRNFAVLLDNDIAEQMFQDGWNVKRMKPRDDDEPGMLPQAFLPVAVSYKSRPPRISMVTSRGRNDIGEDLVELLDYAEILEADLIVNPYEWSVGGRGGIKAYLKTMFAKIQEDELEEEYADVPVLNRAPQRRAIEAGDSNVIEAEVVDDGFEDD